MSTTLKASLAILVAAVIGLGLALAVLSGSTDDEGDAVTTAPTAELPPQVPGSSPVTPTTAAPTTTPVAPTTTVTEPPPATTTTATETATTTTADTTTATQPDLTVADPDEIK